MHRRRGPSRVWEGRGATLLGFRDTGSCTGHRHGGKTDGELYLYKYDKVGKTDPLQMSPRPAAMAPCRVATLVCPVRST